MIENKILSCFRINKVPSCNMLVAVSGGADSVALFHLITKVKSILGLNRIGVVHLNFHLRGTESDEEAQFVSLLAGEFGVPLYIKDVTGKSIDEPGIEEWARTERYRFFEEVRNKHGYPWCATAHTIDDQAETFLFNVMRGTGLSGMRAIAPVHRGVIRPLLSTTKEELRSWLVYHGYAWHEDRSNEDQRFKRNWIRHTILPVMMKREPGTLVHIGACVRQIQQGYAVIQERISEVLRHRYQGVDDNTFIFLKPVDSREDFSLREVFVHILRSHGIGFSSCHIDLCMTLLHHSGGEYLLPDSWRAYPCRDKITFVKQGKKPSGTGGATPLPIPGETAAHGHSFRMEAYAGGGLQIAYDPANFTVYLDREKAGRSFTCHRIEHFDFFHPLGYDKAVKLISYLKKRGMNRFYRESAITVKNQDGLIVWIPGVGVSETCKITDHTEVVLKATCRRQRIAVS